MPARGGVPEAVWRLSDAASMYEKRRAATLQAPCILRLASVHAGVQAVPRWGVRIEVFDCMWRAEMAAEGLPLADRVAVIGSVAALAARMGCHRRMAGAVKTQS